MDTQLHKFCVGAGLTEDHKQRFVERALKDNAATLLHLAQTYNAKYTDSTFPALAIFVVVGPPPILWDAISTLYAPDAGAPALEALMARHPGNADLVQQICTVVAHLCEKKFPVYFVWTTDGMLTPVTTSGPSTIQQVNLDSEDELLLSLIYQSVQSM